MDQSQDLAQRNGLMMRLKTMPRASYIVISGMLLVSLAGCARELDVVPGLAVEAPVVALGQSDFSAAGPDRYFLRPADVLSITVFRESELSLPAVAVSAEGLVSLPLVGTLEVSGMTPGELEERLEQLYNARYLRDPDVTVNVVQYASHLVTVEGAVTTPGVYDFQPGLRLSGAIARAAGATRTADANNVAVFRQGPAGMQIAKFDYAAVQSGTMLDPVMQPGDRVVVGTDSLSQLWQDVLRAVPVFAIFTNL
jgi:polysaccharide biosynthesis/export protein